MNNTLLRLSTIFAIQLLFQLVFLQISTLSLADLDLGTQLQRDKLFFAQLDHRPSPEAYVIHEIFNWTSSQPPSAVIYGNDEIGYFSSKNFILDKKQLKFRFIPPTYRQALVFSGVDSKDKAVPLATKKFENPFGKFTEGLATISGVFSFPFILMNGTTKSVPVVVNRLGELVWLFSNSSHLLNVDTTAVEALEGGDFMFLGIGKTTRLTWIDSFGKVVKDIDFQKENIPYPNTHTVQYLKKTNEILFLTHDCRELSMMDEFIQLFNGPAGWIRLLTLPRRSYMGSKLVRMSLDTLKVTEVWNSFRDYSPKNNPSLATGFLTTTDRFMDAIDSDQYLKFLAIRDFTNWSNWPDQHCHVDWTHENSAQFIEGKGYLVSVRNLNEIIFLDEKGQRLWNIGEGPGHTYNMPRDGSAFSMQHSATMLSDGKILLYDNKTPYRGFTGWRLGNRVMMLDPKAPGHLLPFWIFDLFTAHSDIRGSVAMLPNDRIFSYSAGNPGVGIDFFDIDIKTKKAKARMRYNLLQGNKGFQAQPLWAFGGDTYIGTEKNQPKKTDPVPDQDFLQFSY